MKHDTIIIGTGIIGLTCALKLARAEMSVLLFDKDPEPKPAEKITARVSALSPTSIQLLKKLEIWDQIPKEFLRHFDQMHLLDQTQSQTVHFNAEELNQKQLGAILDNTALRFALFERLKTHSNVECIFNGEATKIEPQPESVRLHTNLGIKTATLLIGADGAQSWTREQAKIECKTTQYPHHALVATVVTEKPHQNTAWQSFLNTGPLAFLPLNDPHTCAIVWSTSPAEAEQLKSLPDENFCETLTTKFSNQLGMIKNTGFRMVIPLIKRHAVSYGKNRIALCGDAAHSIHPMAGQGMNLGFLDADLLSNLITERFTQNRDFGAESLLKQYHRRRYYHNQMMLTGLDALDKIFTTSNDFLKNLRKMGLSAVDQSTLLQRLFTRIAGGDSGLT